MLTYFERRKHHWTTSWFPVWLVLNKLFCLCWINNIFTCVMESEPENRRSAIQWYFPSWNKWVGRYSPSSLLPLTGSTILVNLSGGSPLTMLTPPSIMVFSTRASSVRASPMRRWRSSMFVVWNSGCNFLINGQFRALFLLCLSYIQSSFVRALSPNLKINLTAFKRMEIFLRPLHYSDLHILTTEWSSYLSHFWKLLSP